MDQGSELLAGSGGGTRGVARFVTADVRQTLGQIRDSPALAEGKVCLIALDAVRDRLGARWPGRRDMVYQHVVATLRRKLGPHGFYARISETDFLVVQPAVTRLAGQAYCLNCLREVLTYFLGEALVSDIAVLEVSTIGETGVNARRLDALAVEAEAQRVELDERAKPGAVAPPFSLISQDRWTPFVAHDGRPLRASCQLEPVFQLKTYGRIGYRMTRRVLQLPSETPLSVAEQRQLTGADIERIDFATLARGLNRLEQEGAGERQPSLILPVSYSTLSSYRGRAMLAQFFRAAQQNVQRGLICEVCDIEGVPPSTLLAATSLMRPFCLFIVGRLAATPPAPLLALKDAGLQGLSIECPPGLESDEAFGAFAKAMMTAAKPVGRSLLFYGVSGPRQAAIASLYGATHASFAPANPVTETAEDDALETA
jgi:GGDEF domain-containing protein